MPNLTRGMTKKKKYAKKLIKSSTHMLSFVAMSDIMILAKAVFKICSLSVRFLMET